MNETYCKVKYCRYPHTHTTSGHRCGVVGCKNPYGHGQVEHYNLELKNKLKIYHSNKLPENKQCTVHNCKHKHNHTNESHFCSKCERRVNHSEEDCIIQDIDEACNKWGLDKSKIEDFIHFKNNIIFEINVGMGCSLFILKKNNILSTIFMHSDSWGQYGPETDDSNILTKYQEGLTFVTTEWWGFNETSKIKCPMCRTLNLKDEIKFIKGLDAKCIVCMENNIEVYFSACEHSVVCKICLTQLNN